MIEEKKSFSTEELEIVEEFKRGIPIRKLAEKHEGFGRTKIRNILTSYVQQFPKEKKDIEDLLLSNKTHKPKEKVDEVKDKAELTEEEIKDIYDKIRNGETLTSLAQTYGRTRDYLKKRVLEYLDDENDIQEFLKILKENQNKNGKNDYVDFFNSSNTLKISMIINRLNARRRNANKPEYSFLLLMRKFAKIKQYFLIQRNSNIENEEDKLTENDFWRMLYDNPTLLSSSLEDRIIPTLDFLDKHPDVGYKNATRIIREDASIISSSINRTKLQLKILKDNDLLEAFFSKPRNFRTSPELIYALINFSKDKNNDNKNLHFSSIFLTRKKLEEKFNVTPEDLIGEYDIRDKYGNDEYFK